MQAMVAPCDLWVIPTPRFSNWFTHLDWYLNWQMCKGLAYGGLHLPSETYRVAEEYGVSLPAPGRESAPPLLISSEGQVTARGCLVVDAAGGLREWLAAARVHLISLNARSARLFLPHGVKAEDARELWSACACDVEFVPDLEIPK